MTLKEQIWNNVYNNCLDGCKEIYTHFQIISKLTNIKVSSEEMLDILSYVAQGCKETTSMFKNSTLITPRPIIVSLVPEKYFNRISETLGRLVPLDDNIDGETISVSLPIKRGKMYILVINVDRIDALKDDVRQMFYDNLVAVAPYSEKFTTERFVYFYTKMILIHTLRNGRIYKYFSRFRWHKNMTLNRLRLIYNKFNKEDQI